MSGDARANSHNGNQQCTMHNGHIGLLSPQSSVLGPQSVQVQGDLRPATLARLFIWLCVASSPSFASSLPLRRRSAVSAVRDRDEAIVQS